MSRNATSAQFKATMRTRVPRQAFGLTLRDLTRRPTDDLTPGLLAKLSGVPKAGEAELLYASAGRPRPTARLDVGVANAVPEFA